MLTDPSDPPFTGGPAFPCSAWPPPGHEGMSLRDWFAGQALTILAHKHWWDGVVPTVDLIGMNAYLIADEMLRARAAVPCACKAAGHTQATDCQCVCGHAYVR